MLLGQLLGSVVRLGSLEDFRVFWGLLGSGLLVSFRVFRGL